MITYPTDKLQKVLLSGGCEQNDTPTPSTPMDIVCNNGTIKISPNLFNKNNRERIYGFFPSTGSSWTYNIQAYSNRIPCLPNTTYIARYNGNSEQAVLGFGSTHYNNVPTNGSNIPVTNSVRQTTPTIETPITITTGANDKWLIVAYNVADPQNTDMADNLQVEQGATATTYMGYAQPYVEGTTETVTDNVGNVATCQNLFAASDYKDTQEILSGAVTRNVGVKVLDGTEDWTEISGTYATPLANTAIKKIPNSTVIICSHFYGIASLTAVTSMPNLSAKVTNSTELGSKFALFIKYTMATTVAKFQTYLADQYANGIPVIVVYPLATPTTEQVTPQPLAGSSATVTAGSIDNLPIESSTIAELKKRYIGNNKVERIFIGNNKVWETDN